VLMDLKKRGYEVVNWINLAVEKAVMKLQVP
jgi:hypothetical protein